MRETTATALLSLSLVLNLLPLMTFPAVLPAASVALDLTPAEAGWVGGIFFAAIPSPFSAFRVSPTGMIQSGFISPAVCSASSRALGSHSGRRDFGRR